MSTMTPDWRGDSEERLTPDVLRWFRERVRFELRDAALKTTPPVPAHLALALEEAFACLPERYLVWVPDESFRRRAWDDDEDEVRVPGAWLPRKRFRIEIFPPDASRYCELTGFPPIIPSV